MPITTEIFGAAYWALSATAICEKYVGPGGAWYFDPHEAQGGCGLCVFGWLHLSYLVAGHPTEHHREHVQRLCCRCLCEHGQKLGAKLPDIERFVTREGLYELWPGGPPIRETTAGLLEHAGIPRACWSWTLDSYKKRFGNSREVKQYVKSAGEWLAELPAKRSDVLLYGPPGTGKTGLAVALALALVARKERVHFTEAKYLFMRWRDTYGKDATQSEIGFFAEMVAHPVLIVDEAVSAGSSEHVDSGLHLLLDRRQKAYRPTILTLNLAADVTPQGAAEQLPALLGPALYDRLRERAQSWPLLGRSRRSTLLPFTAPQAGVPPAPPQG